MAEREDQPPPAAQDAEDLYGGAGSTAAPVDDDEDDDGVELFLDQQTAVERQAMGTGGKISLTRGGAHAGGAGGMGRGAMAADRGRGGRMGGGAPMAGPRGAGAPTSRSGVTAGLPQGARTGKNVLEVNIEDLADKPWRQPGANLADYFNYGFNEQSWKVYVEKQALLREQANMQSRIEVAGGGDDDDGRPRDDRERAARDRERDRDDARDRDDRDAERRPVR